jgi:hypothetical protein
MTEQGATRVNVSIPKALKARMDEADEPVNWSAVAAAAFEAKLLELASRKEATTMDEVIARMKAAEERDSKEDYQAGVRCGENWAKLRATPKQLRRLQNAGGEGTSIEELLSAYARGLNRGIAWGLYVDLTGEADPDRRDVEQFVEGVLGVELASLDEWDFARGFIEGALDVWHKVENRL